MASGDASDEGLKEQLLSENKAHDGNDGKKATQNGHTPASAFPLGNKASGSMPMVCDAQATPIGEGIRESSAPMPSNPRPRLSDKRAAVNKRLLQVFKGRCYHAQARDIHDLRSELNTPIFPVSHRQLRRLTDKSQRKKGSIVINTERDSAIEAVFRTEEAFKSFKAKYEAPINIERRKDHEIHENLSIERHTPGHLTTKRLMYTTATRNRQRTLTFAQSGGVSGGGASSASTALQPTSLSIGTGLGLAAFAPHLLHSATDAKIAIPNIDVEEMPENEDISNHIEMESLLARRRPQRGLERKAGSSLLKPRSYGVLQSPLPIPATTVVAEHQRLLSATNTGRVQYEESKPCSPAASRRTSITRQDILAIAMEQMGKGRRGPSAHGEKPRILAPGTTANYEARHRSHEGGLTPNNQNGASWKTSIVGKMESGFGDGTAILGNMTAVKDNKLPLIPTPRIDEQSVETKPAVADVLYQRKLGIASSDKSILALADQPVEAYRNRRRKTRVIRTWQPISLSAASETKRTIVPTNLFRLPALSCGSSLDSASRLPLIPTLRFWNPPL
ncbi:hypothetical protein DFJ77DRAFT_268258 [Powellomyces hirtus]|nr:hypothetical protein DFJ77DRAFT_268258 [Powellomyces hirtus]